MKTKNFLMLLGVTLALLALLIFGCEKSPDEPDKPQAVVPTLTTTDVSAITETTAFSGGNITTDGGAAVTARGVCWSTSANPTIASSKTTDGAGTDDFISSLTDLTTKTTYYVRAYATNSAGIGYGNEVNFITLDLIYGTVTDIDANVYHTVSIGTQVWMKENLKVTKYRDGTAIPLVTDLTAWNNLLTPAYCWYNNNEATYKATYGALYNWFTVNTGKLCPTGWHVSTDAEWTTLTTYLGGESVAGGKLKETGTTHWWDPNTGATNSSGFTALPGGLRDGWGFFYNGNYGFWWSPSPSDLDTDCCGYSREVKHDFSDVGKDGASKQNGLSVRCLKD